MYSNGLEEEKISVIIPVYNTAMYLEKCLNSICCQTYKNLEIICIDDGSTDGSEKIVDEFAKKDSRVIAIHKSNGGESSARNAGLQICTGNYIAFVDCDDWLEPDMYEKMFQTMKENHADIAACSFFLENQLESRPMQNEYPVSEDVFGRKELFQYLYIRDRYKGVTSWIWCKLFKRNILFENGKLIEFDEQLRFGGDILFLVHAAAKVKKACYLPDALYHYYQRSSSTSHSKNLEILSDILTAYQNMIDFLERNNIETEMILWLQRFKAYWASLIAERAYKQGDALTLSRCQQVMREYGEAYIKTNQEYPKRLKRYREILKFSI